MTEELDFVYALATSPNFARDGFCLAARQSGLYRSEDGGLTWRFAFDSLNLQAPLATLSVAVSPDFGSDPTVFAGVSGGILRSIDRGEHWEAISLSAPPPHVSALVISPNFAQDGLLLAGTFEDGVFRSADRGRHWSAWNFGLLDLNILCLVISPNFAEDEILLVGVDSGIFRSTNGGLAWREVDFPPEFAPVLSLALSPNFAQDGILLAGTESHGLFRSTDRGQTWVRLAEEVITGVVNSIIMSSQFPAQPDMLALLEESLLISRDGGQTWSNWTTDLPTEVGLAAVAAPYGLAPGSPLLLGLYDGRVVRILP